MGFGRIGCSGARQDDYVVLSTSDRSDLILILIVKSMKQDELLVAVRGVDEGIDVQCDLAGLNGEGLHEPKTNCCGDCKLMNNPS